MMLALVIALGIVDAGLLVWNWRLSRENRVLKLAVDLAARDIVEVGLGIDTAESLWAAYCRDSFQVNHTAPQQKSP
jgi:hypothetical protein